MLINHYKRDWRLLKEIVMFGKALKLANSYFGVLTIAGVLSVAVFVFFGFSLTTFLVAAGLGVTAGVVNGIREVAEHGH